MQNFIQKVMNYLKKDDSAKLRAFIKKHWKMILVVLYVLSPIDLIPDFIVGLGFTDDALLMILTIVYELMKQNSLNMEKPAGEDSVRKDPSAKKVNFDKKENISEGEIIK